MKKILVCGNSIFMAGLATSLRATANVEVVQLDLRGATRDLEGLPDMVIVDMADWSSELTQWCVQRNLLLVGMNVNSGTLTVLSGKSFPASSIEEALKWLADLSGTSTSQSAK